MVAFFVVAFVMSLSKHYSNYKDFETYVFVLPHQIPLETQIPSPVLRAHWFVLSWAYDVFVGLLNGEVN